MKLSKSISKSLLALTIIPLSLLVFSSSNQVHADPTVKYSGDGTAKQIYEDTGLTKAQLKKDHENSEKIANNYHGDIDTGIKKSVKHKNVKATKKAQKNTKKVSFYISKDLKNIRHAKVKVLKPMMEHKNISFKRNHMDKKVKRSHVFKVLKIMKFKHVYRFKLSNHKYVTSNKEFVKLIK